MLIVDIYTNDPKLASLREFVESAQKVEIPVASWTHVHDKGDTVYGPHFRICFKSDQTCAFRSAWHRDEQGSVVQHDYLMGLQETSVLKENFGKLFTSFQ